MECGLLRILVEIESADFSQRDVLLIPIFRQVKNIIYDVVTMREY